MTDKIRVYLEIGGHRTFACALDWPGWSRAGRNEDLALRALFDYAPRYAKAVRAARLGFKAPRSMAELLTVDTLKGGASVDFGTPARIPLQDEEPLKGADMQRLQGLLRACWRYFDAAALAARGRKLSLGPRGGGRTLEAIVEHVLGAEAAYLARLGGKAEQAGSAPQAREETRKALLKTLQASANGEIAEYGPRGGKRWPARYFVRREAWHVLDHAWEIEDRAT